MPWCTSLKMYCFLSPHRIIRSCVIASVNPGNTRNYLWKKMTCYRCYGFSRFHLILFLFSQILLIMCSCHLVNSDVGYAWCTARFFALNKNIACMLQCSKRVSPLTSFVTSVFQKLPTLNSKLIIQKGFHKSSHVKRNSFSHLKPYLIQHYSSSLFLKICLPEELSIPKKYFELNAFHCHWSRAYNEIGSTALQYAARQ